MKDALVSTLIAIALSATESLFTQGLMGQPVAGMSHETSPANLRWKITLSLPAGTKMFYVNITDSAGNIVSTDVVTLGVPSSADLSSAERICFDSTVWVAPRIYDDAPDSLKFPNEEAFYFAGLDYQGHKTKVFAYTGFPAHASAARKVPGIVLVHGGGGTAFPLWVKAWNDEGFAAIAMDLEGRQPTVSGPPSLLLSGHPLAGPKNSLFADVDKRIEDQWLYHAVANVYLAYSVLASDYRVDKDHIGITGISWGGIVTSIAIGNADCYAFAIPVYGCGYLHRSKALYKSIYTDTVAKLWDASRWLRSINTPTLWINGESDPIFSIDATTKSARATPDSRLTIIPGLQHGHAQGWSPREIYTFANSIARGGKGLVKILKQPTENDLAVEVDASGSYGIKSAVLISSQDTLSYDADSHPTNVWLQKPIEPSSFHR
jgi:dienelactone hydrolase